MIFRTTYEQSCIVGGFAEKLLNFLLTKIVYILRFEAPRLQYFLQTFFVRTWRGSSLNSRTTSPSMRPSSNAALSGETCVTRASEFFRSQLFGFRFSEMPPTSLIPNPVLARGRRNLSVLSKKQG